MTKSEIVSRLAAAKPHLTQRNLEIIDATIFGEVGAAFRLHGPIWRVADGVDSAARRVPTARPTSLRGRTRGKPTIQSSSATASANGLAPA